MKKNCNEDTWIHRGVVAKVVDFYVVVSKFKFRSCNDVHFRTNTFGKSKNFLMPQLLVK